ncbi:MAG TPA: manganese-dependent inorganic pyrophosphatase [Campylobacterales bacterium]|nr:manganese-dependent inorganic pyrophosphatase [Campylobacterales bacterium]
MALYIVGHKIPDSDSICSAIAVAYLKNRQGIEAIACKQGDINPETTFILDKFGLDTPITKNSFAGVDTFITDTTDLTLCPDDIMDANVIGVVDHHKLGDLTTSTPLEAWIRPVGCSNTIVKEMFDFYGVEIPKDIAGIMLCAILSDTVIFKSPTCTKADTKAVKELAEIAGIENPKELGIEMFKIKSEVEGTSIRDLVKRDFKDFNMNGTKVGIGQLEVVDLSVFDSMKDDLMKDLEALKVEGDRHSVLLLLTDIMKEGSELLISSNDESKIEEAFNQKPKDSKMWLDGVLSRKKQIVPFLEKVFK